MDRRRFLLTSLAGAFVAPLAAGAQHAEKVYRLGVLRTESRVSAPHLLTALETGLREVGYVQGQNLTIDYRFADGKTERLAQLAAELIKLQPDVLIAITTSAAIALKRATTIIPIVMLSFAEPVSAGLVTNLARPGGNITGLSAEVGAEIAGKQLQLLREVAVAMHRLAVLANPTYQPTATRRKALSQVADQLGVALLPVDVTTTDGIADAFTAIRREKADGLFVFGDPLVFSLRRQIGDWATKNHLPSVSQYREGADAGGLLAYGPHFADTFRRIGIYETRFSRAPSPATCLSSSRPSSSWSSTSRPPRPSASQSRRRCWRVRIR
jgi:putative tryptophan/tyrosine transport system substrate-binding protein